VIEPAGRAIEAHGGGELWAGAEAVEVELSAGGFAFATKLQGAAVRATRIRVSTRRQHVVLEDFPREGRRGVFDGDGSVRIETVDGEPLQTRADARRAFADLRHKLWWDKLDILYFSGYAIWTYLAAPFVFALDGYELAPLGQWTERGETWERIGVRFPETIHTHSRDQVFYVDERGWIRRHDYTAEPFGEWAKAVHYSTDHKRFDGLLVPTRRRVYPRRADNRPRAHPRLVWIDLSDAKVVRAG
jgi:hypothetical protein